MRILIPLVFVLLAVWMLVFAPSARPELPERVVIDPASIDPGATRPLLQDPPKVEIGGMVQGCNDCHALFESPPETHKTVYQHEHIALDHGNNDRCLNCHDRANRDKLRLHGTATIGFDDVVQLCAKCHGTTWRDWERGMHGRTNGYWDPASGEQKRLGCTECHDPHAPAFPEIEPLPGPNTLRMGERPHDAGHHEEDRGPLARGLRAHGGMDAHGAERKEKADHE